MIKLFKGFYVNFLINFLIEDGFLSCMLKIPYCVLDRVFVKP